MLNKEKEKESQEMEIKINEMLREGHPEANIVDHKIKAIGWLDSSEPFEKGEVPKGFLEKLEMLWNQGLMIGTMGHHECDFCEGGYGTNERAQSSCEKILTDKVNKIRYMFPEMIFHYIKKHQFKPSDEFIEFVMKS